MENMVEDWRDQKILTLLSENPKGLRHSMLLKKTEFAKKTLQTHLDFLVREKMKERIKNKKKRKNAKTVYKVILEKDDLVHMQELTKLTLSPIDFLYKSNKTARLSSICHLFQIFSTLYYHSMLHYVIYPKGKITYSTHLKMLENRLDELRDYIHKEFSEKQIERIDEESMLINNADYESAFDKFTIVLTHRPYYRTQDEIFRDNSFIPIYEEKERWDEESNITNTRLELTKDKKLKKKLEKLDQEYDSADDELREIDGKLIDFHVNKDKSEHSKKIKRIIEKQRKMIEPKIAQYNKEENEFLKKFVD